MILIDDSKPYTPEQLKGIFDRLISLAHHVDIYQDAKDRATLSKHQLHLLEQFEQFEVPRSLLTLKFEDGVYPGLGKNATILHALAYLGGNFQFHPEIKRASFTALIHFFVRHGADIDAQDSKKLTPLMVAAGSLKHDRTEVMIPFLENQANPNVVLSNGNSALYYSLACIPQGIDSRRICEESALLLIHHNAEITPKIETTFVHNPILHTLKMTQGHVRLVTHVKTLEDEIDFLKTQLMSVLERVAKLEKAPDHHLNQKQEELPDTRPRYTIFSV